MADPLEVPIDGPSLVVERSRCPSPPLAPHCGGLPQRGDDPCVRPSQRRQGRTLYLGSRDANWLIRRARVRCCSPSVRSPRESVTSLPASARPEDLRRPAWHCACTLLLASSSALFERRDRGFLRGGGGVGWGGGHRGRSRSEGSPSPLCSCPTRGPPVAPLTVHIGQSSDGSCVPPRWPLGVITAANQI
jgi:hypothetical protein